MRSWIPNLITGLRGFAGLIVAVSIIGFHAADLAFILFISAILSDLVDGWIARKLDAISTIGEWLDPLSDKMLMNASWLSLWAVGWAPGWLVGPMMLRDGIVMVGWFTGRMRGIRWIANGTGRIAVSFEGTAVAILMFRHPLAEVHWPTVGVGLGVISLGLSVASGLLYAANPPRSSG